MSQRIILIGTIRGLLNHDPLAEYYCEHGGKFYRFDDMDKLTWEPKPGSRGVDRCVKPGDIYKVKDCVIHFR